MLPPQIGSSSGTTTTLPASFSTSMVVAWNPRLKLAWVLWNNASFYLSGFSGFIHDSFDILCAELYAIYKGLLLANDLEITNLVCYSDSIHCINLVKGSPSSNSMFMVFWFKTSRSWLSRVMSQFTTLFEMEINVQILWLNLELRPTAKLPFILLPWKVFWTL